MKNLKWMTLALAVIFAVGSSFKSAPSASGTYIKYTVSFSNGSKHYIDDDITTQTAGVDYHCDFAFAACAVEGLDTQLHADMDGVYLDAQDDNVHAFLGSYLPWP